MTDTSKEKNIPEKERIGPVLKSLYHISSEAKWTYNKPGEMGLHDPNVKGVIGVNFEDPSNPRSFFFPDREISHLTIEEEDELKQLANQLSLSKPSTPVENVLFLKDPITFLSKSDALTKNGIRISDIFKGQGSKIMVIQVENKDKKQFIVRIPFWLMTDEKESNAAINPVSEAIETARAAIAMPNTRINIQFAVGYVGVTPFFEGIHKELIFKVPENPAVTKIDFHGFSISPKLEYIETPDGTKIYIDIMDPNKQGSFPKLITAQKALKKALEQS